MKAGYWVPCLDFLAAFHCASLRFAVRNELKFVYAKQQQPPVQLPLPQPVGGAPGSTDPAGNANRPVPPKPVLPLPVTLPAVLASAADNETKEAQQSPTEQNSSDGPLPSPAAASLPPQPAPAKPRQLIPAELAVLVARDWLLGGNTIVRVGLVVLFIGLSFLARYAASSGFFPVELRLAAIGAAAIALLAVGFRKRLAKPGFALALQGAGVAVMYLTVFAAFRLYDLLPPLFAFALMLAVCAMSCALALLQNSRSLAIAAVRRAEQPHWSVQLLPAAEPGDLVHRLPARVAHPQCRGLHCHFRRGNCLGILKYAPEHYASSQLFLAAFVLIYLLTAILYARNTPTRLGNAVDSMLVFGTPLAGFGLQAGLVRGMELGTAFSALGFAALYLVTAMVLARRALGSYRLLVECFMAVGVGFATLAVPLALDARWTSAVWALEGAGAFWVGMRQARWMPRAFGLLLQAVAAVAFLDTIDTNISAIPLASCPRARMYWARCSMCGPSRRRWPAWRSMLICLPASPSRSACMPART